MVLLSALGGAGWQFFDASGNPLTGGKLYTYVAGTTTPAPTYTNYSGLTPNSNPIVLDSAGRVTEEIWLTAGQFYKFVLTSAADALIWTKDNVPGIVSADGLNADLINYDPPYSGAVTTNYTVEDKLAQMVSVKDFGAVGNGTTDDTAAFQKALDCGQPVYAPPGEYLITGTIYLQPGACLRGAGGVALYDDALTKIRFQPSSKRDIFNWASTPSTYVFAGVHLEGFTIRGFGVGASACLDLPLLYNGYINFFAYAGIDAWVRVKKWMDTEVRGGCQGFRVFGVEFAKSGIGATAADVTTSTTFDAFISQGPTGYIAQDNSVTTARITGVVESVDCVLNQYRGNVLFGDLYTENAPRTDAGAAFIVGKNGSSPASSTAIYLNLAPGIGYTGGTAANCLMFDLDHARFVRVSGYAYSYGALLATTSNTQKVMFTGLDTDNTPALSLPGGIANYDALVFTGFRPRNLLVAGDTFFNTFDLAGANMELFPVARGDILRRKMGVDAWVGKLRWRDAYNNLSLPIGTIQSSASSAWTFNGAKLAPGELVSFGTSELGQVALWRSQLNSVDTPVSVTGNTNAGSPVIGSGSVPNTFLSINVDDWVTVSGGYGSATFQRRVVSKSADSSQITLDTDATSTVVGVTVATAAHDLVAIAQQGYRTYNANPVGTIVPKYIGEELLRTDTSQWYKSHGLTSADWKAMT